MLTCWQRVGMPAPSQLAKPTRAVCPFRKSARALPRRAWEGRHAGRTQRAAGVVAALSCPRRPGKRRERVSPEEKRVHLSDHQASKRETVGL